MSLKFKNILTIIIFIFVFTFYMGFISAAPAPEYFVINEESKECGIYWPGDEFSYYKLPSGWKIYEPETTLTLDTPFGICSFVYDSPGEYYRECCSYLGFDYVSYDNIPYTTENVIKFDEDDWKCDSRPGKDYYVGITINENNNECTELIDFTLRKPNRVSYPTEGQCFITDNSWIEYEYQIKPEMAEYKLITPFGECENFDPYNYEKCCDDLGLKYIERVTEKEIEDQKETKEIYSIYLIVAILISLIISLIILSKK